MSRVSGEAAAQKAAVHPAQLGFWTYLMTDIVLFATLFATYAVLHDSTAGGPSSAELFDPPFVLAETMILLSSSFTCGLMVVMGRAGRRTAMLSWLVVTFVLGAAFLTLELTEFSHLVQAGHSWQHSAFLSAFFTLVGTHGLHILAGLLWAAVLFAGVMRRGLGEVTQRRMALFAMFWHFLDVVWIFIFTIVYMMGVL